MIQCLSNGRGSLSSTYSYTQFVNAKLGNQRATRVDHATPTSDSQSMPERSTQLRQEPKTLFAMRSTILLND